MYIREIGNEAGGIVKDYVNVLDTIETYYRKLFKKVMWKKNRQNSR